MGAATRRTQRRSTTDFKTADVKRPTSGRASTRHGCQQAVGQPMTVDKRRLEAPFASEPGLNRGSEDDDLAPYMQADPLARSATHHGRVFHDFLRGANFVDFVVANGRCSEEKRRKYRHRPCLPNGGKPSTSGNWLVSLLGHGRFHDNRNPGPAGAGVDAEGSPIHRQGQATLDLVSNGSPTSPLAHYAGRWPTVREKTAVLRLLPVKLNGPTLAHELAMMARLLQKPWQPSPLRMFDNPKRPFRPAAVVDSWSQWNRCAQAALSSALTRCGSPGTKRSGDFSLSPSSSPTKSPLRTTSDNPYLDPS
jgi:hypothetical protein